MNVHSLPHLSPSWRHESVSWKGTFVAQSGPSGVARQSVQLGSAPQSVADWQQAPALTHSAHSLSGKTSMLRQIGYTHADVFLHCSL